MNSKGSQLRQVAVAAFAVLLTAAGVITSYLAIGAGGASAGGPPTCVADCATAFAPPIANGGPFGITRGPLGSIYFSLADSLARIDQQGQITVHPLRAGAFTGWLTTGPASDVWFAERRTGRIGVLHADGTIREYALPTPTAIPQGIVFAADGDIYVTEQGANAIARVDPLTGTAVDIPSLHRTPPSRAAPSAPTAPSGSSNAAPTRSAE